MCCIVINSNFLNPNQKQKFPIRRLADGTPCIVGTVPKQQTPDGTTLIVFSPAGTYTSMHPGERSNEVLYEIHKDDFVFVMDRCNNVANYEINSFHILFITNDFAYGEPAVL